MAILMGLWLQHRGQEKLLHRVTMSQVRFGSIDVLVLHISEFWLHELSATLNADRPGHGAPVKNQHINFENQ